MRLCALPLLLLASLSAEELRDLEFARPGGTPLTLDAYLPPSQKPRPAVLLVHGGGWEAGDKRTYIRPWFETLTAAGLAWFSIDYRLGPAHKHPAAVEDIEAALRFLRANAKKFNIDPRRIAIMGESAGGHLAMLVALRGREHVKAAVSFYGIHDLDSWARQRGGELPKNICGYLSDTARATLKDASPSTYVSRRNPPTLFVHGTGDKGVPSQQSSEMCGRMKQAGADCEVFLISGAPHGVENWEKDPAFQVWKPKVVEWLKVQLGEKAGAHAGRPSQ